VIELYRNSPINSIIIVHIADFFKRLIIWTVMLRDRWANIIKAVRENKRFQSFCGECSGLPIFFVRGELYEERPESLYKNRPGVFFLNDVAAPSSDGRGRLRGAE